MPSKIFKLKDINLEQVKILVPEILIECKDKLGSGKYFPETLDYLQIKKFYPEENGDIDHCGGHYQLLTRIYHSNSRLNFSYWDFGSSPGLSIEIRAQYECNLGKGWPLQEVEDKVQNVLEKENLSYELHELKSEEGRFIEPIH